jgi:hypothetical protein
LSKFEILKIKYLLRERKEKKKNIRRGKDHIAKKDVLEEAGIDKKNFLCIHKQDSSLCLMQSTKKGFFVTPTKNKYILKTH